jgi:hypothetical protein
MWLAIQMLLYLLIAAAFGGVAGWFAHELFRKQLAVRAITNQALGSEASARPSCLKKKRSMPTFGESQGSQGQAKKVRWRKARWPGATAIWNRACGSWKAS